MNARYYEIARAATVTLVLSLAGLMALPAEAFERRGDDKILVVGMRQAVPIMDPSIKYDASIRTMQQAMYDALLKYEGSPPKVMPWLAKSWDVSDDGLTYTFKLVDNAKFHNGDPVTAEAVRWYVEHEEWWRAIKDHDEEYRAYYQKQYGERLKK